MNAQKQITRDIRRMHINAAAASSFERVKANHDRKIANRARIRAAQAAKKALHNTGE